MPVTENSGTIGDLSVFWRSAPAVRGSGTSPTGSAAGADAVPLYLHGVPSSSLEWLPFLELTGGLAPDLPGFGRSDKPARLSYTIGEYDRFIERFLDHVGVRRVKLVVHDWGAVGLAFAQRLPERVERLAIVNAVPFLPGYRWHRTAKAWRTPGLGELSMLTTNRTTLRLVSYESNATPGPMPQRWQDDVMAHLDAATRRAILRLYRSSPPSVLAAAGAGLGRLDVPALVLWGMRDPYIAGRFAAEYARALPRAELVELPDAGHWPWFDRPDAIARLADFLNAG